MSRLNKYVKECKPRAECLCSITTKDWQQKFINITLSIPNVHTVLWPVQRKRHDPILEEGGINLYGYVGNNSINYVDPFGLSDEGAKAAYGETGGLYPQQLPRPAGATSWSIYNSKTWDPNSYNDLQRARQAIADIRERNKHTKQKDGSASDNSIEKKAWNDCKSAAAKADTWDMFPDVDHFYLRQDGVGTQTPPWANGAPAFAYGPFVNIGGGDVPKGKKTYVDVYKGVK